MASEVLERELGVCEGADEAGYNCGFGVLVGGTEGDGGKFVFFAYPEVGVDDGGDEKFTIAPVVAGEVGTNVCTLIEELVTGRADLAEDGGSCFGVAFAFVFLKMR